MKVYTSLFLVLFSIFGLFAQELAEVKQIVLSSKTLLQNREILIYTPQSYKENYLTQYEVIFVFDAHTREFFDLVHSSISFLSSSSKQFIVVGITSPYNEGLDYSRRNDFYRKCKLMKRVKLMENTVEMPINFSSLSPKKCFRICKKTTVF